MSYGFDYEAVKNAVSNNYSYAGVLRDIGKNPYSSGSQGCLKRFIQRNKIDNSHFTGQRHSKHMQRKKWNELSPLISTHLIKTRCWADGALPKHCQICGLDKWQGKDAPLQLHHKDGDRTNNDINNLQILCANCHAQTETYCRRKKLPIDTGNDLL